VPACGPMQIKQRFHQQRCPECDFSTVPGQIELATHIIGDFMKSLGVDEYHALVAPGSYFPGDDVNGTTQGSYVARVRKLVGVMKGGTTPAPKPFTAAEVLRLIAGPTATVGFGFNQANMSCDGPCRFYTYGVGHGTSADYMHTGDDIEVPRGTTLRTPLAGRVTCVGTQGEVTWEQGCGSFTDTSGGIGNVTVLTDAGLKITFGHCAKALVAYNQRVEAGQPIALSGTNRADHLHLDVVTKRNGAYWLNDPLPTLAAAMSGMSLPTAYADPIDIPQPADFDAWWTATALRDGVKVYQRADPNSPESYRPLRKGEEVEIVYLVIGADNAPWAITRNRRRIPASGLDLSAIPALQGDA
jgi:murein DD-endopeptidase MepM/ murein hydrolase activator NlpD